MYLDFLKYYFKASTAHGIHSPHVFDFYTKILKNRTSYPEFNVIENERSKLIKNSNKILRVDFGAGKKKQSQESISTLAKTSLKSKKWGQFLFKLIKFYSYENTLDLGTSFGITTAYISKANLNSKVYTLEGCPETLKIAEEVFENLEIKNIVTTCGNIDYTLQEVLKKMPSLDFVFFDANHTKEATVSYFETCLKFKNNNSCFVFDDIYWSEPMKEAWNYIISHPESIITIDLFYMGIVFFRNGIKKQNFILK